MDTAKPPLYDLGQMSKVGVANDSVSQVKDSCDDTKVVLA